MTRLQHNNLVHASAGLLIRRFHLAILFMLALFTAAAVSYAALLHARPAADLPAASAANHATVVVILMAVGLYMLSRRLLVSLNENLILPLHSLKQLIESDAEAAPLASTFGEVRALHNSIIAQRRRENQKPQVVEVSALARASRLLMHDIRKPFSVLRMAASSLCHAKDQAEITQTMARLGPEVDKAVSAVDRLLADAMTIGSADTQMQLEPIGPESLIASVIREAFQACPKANISLSYNFKHRHMINGQIQGVSRVFSKIVQNALQAMNHKGEMWFRTVERNGFIEFCIGNSGSWIPSATLPKIFEAFFSEGKPSCAGLGLSVAKKIITDHGGRIWCESSKTLRHPDGKVELFFTLPLATNLTRWHAGLVSHSTAIALGDGDMCEAVTQVSAEHGESALESNITRVCEKLGRPLKILVVDDEPIYRTALVSFLDRCPQNTDLLTVIQAMSSAQALTLAFQHEFDLIITDVDMGVDSLDGFELVQELRKNSAQGFICVHSNRFLTADHKTAMAAGADAFLPKPMPRAQLLRLALQASQVSEQPRSAVSS